MAGSDIAIVVLAVAAFTIFGAVLGWASWEESCAAPRKKKRLNDELANSKGSKPNNSDGSLMPEIARLTKGVGPQRRSF